ncbi:hypothetical protein [Thalassotalea euphylliae]|uniref:Uncharacterized protein n=1 Tax=Thalassotalea euphylliae TaxID=1655234 RepID=A0A3E0U2N3_9GAMM|nr:hypothetical protein [Thalassotalea euphylliae]REL30857.1 hypothetical protein DXX94_09060 [Thalassotalea euphylliae]
MKKIPLAITLALSTNAFAYTHPLQDTDLQPKESSYKCTSLSQLDEKSLIEDNNYLADFLLSPDYCINNSKYSSYITPDMMISKSDISDIYSNYYKLYESLESLEEKIHFVHFFLQEASKRYFLASGYQNREDELRLIFYSPKTNGGSRGYSFYPFGRDNFTPEFAQQYKKTTQKITNTPDNIQALVNQLLGLDHKKKLKSISDLQPFNNNSSDSDRDSDYMDWAEEQASNWCDTCRDDGWGSDRDTREAYLVIKDDYGNRWEAYHYSPWDDDWWR